MVGRDGGAGGSSPGGPGGALLAIWSEEARVRAAERQGDGSRKPFVSGGVGMKQGLLCSREGLGEAGPMDGLGRFLSPQLRGGTVTRLPGRQL